MTTPKSFFKNKLFEIGRTIVYKPRKKKIEFYHKKISWWLRIYGIRFKHVAYYIMVKKTCI